MSETLVVWEKWVDPFGQEINEAKWMDYENSIEEYEETELLDEDRNSLVEFPKMKSIRAITTPMGIIPYNELTAPGSIFNFWVGHTNFDLNNKVCKIIEKSEGVEILDIFSRYRFRIAIGKCFSDSETMANINKELYRVLVK